MLYKSLLKPLLFKLDAERAHELTCTIAEKTGSSELLASLVNLAYNYQSPLLTQQFWGKTFRNPIGPAAGFDKNGCLVPAMQTMGMGFVEVGSITARASCGNPKPRAFRLPEDRAIINRMGLNNDGAQTIIRRLQNTSHSIPLGVNIAKTHAPDIMGEKAIEDYRFSYKEASKVADYITINISCPNTAEGKTFEDPAVLDDLLSVLLKAGRIDPVPTLVKFSSDLSRPQLQALIETCEAHHVAGYIAANTTSNRENLVTSQNQLDAIGSGGLSGIPLAEKSGRIIKWTREIIGLQKPIIGVGGIDSFESALEMLKAGANLLQLYTGMIYEGPALVKKINKGLVNYMKKNKLDSLKAIYCRQ